MMQILELRARLRELYQKFQIIIDPLLRFIVAFVTFTVINNAIGYDARFDKIIIVFLLSLLCSFTPSSVLVFLAMTLSLAHVYSVAKLLSILMIFVFLVLYLLFVRFTPKLGYVVLGIPILFGLNIPYVFPILLGLIATPLTILPAGCGVAVYYLIHIIQEEVATTADITDPEDILLLYMNVIDKIVKNNQLIMTVAVFAIIISVVYVVRRLKIEYAFEIAIGAGAITSIISFLIVDLKLSIPKQIGAMILGTLISAVIVVIIQFFRRVLDYTAVENVQFEDDDYYYYVKAVPKINVSMTNIKVKRINAQKITEPMNDEDDEEEDDFTSARELDRRILERRTLEAKRSDTLRIDD
jgi:hypothetical protein